MGKRGKRRKVDEEEEDDGDTSSVDEDKYMTLKVENYSRQYPEDGGNFEYIVIYESVDVGKPLRDRDLMSLGACLKRSNKGIKRFKRINKFKIGAIFERPGQANATLNNTKCLIDLKLKAAVPAALTETTGVITSVPTYMSNKRIYDGISSSRDIVSVLMMRRSRDESGASILSPTLTLAITFACPVLPDYVDIDFWYFPVKTYIPPVSQCLRYGHIVLDDIFNTRVEVWCKLQANTFNCADGGYHERYYYDILMEDCKLANIGVKCGVDLNVFHSIERCRNTCQEFGQEVLKPYKKYGFNVTCRLQADFGSCNDYYPRFFFSVPEKKCRGFSFSGCGGNNNRFDTLEACSKACEPMVNEF